MKITSYTKKAINPRTNNHTFFTVEFRNPVTGRPTRKRGFTGKREAKQAVMKLLVQLENSDISNNPNIKFDQVAERWLANKKRLVAGSTYRKYYSYYNNHLVGAFGNAKMTDITLQDCQKLVYSLSDKYKRWDKIIGTFSSVFKYAVKYGLIQSNPFDRVDRPKIKHDNLPKSFTSEEFVEFNKAIKEQYEAQNPKAFTLLWLLSHTGLRKGEALGLQWEAIDLNNGYIDVHKAITRDYDDHLIQGTQPKNQYSIRTVPIGNSTIKILKKWRIIQRHQLKYFNIDTNQASQLVFTSQKGGILSPSKPGKWLNSVTKKHGLPSITVHGLRHTYATLLAQNNVAAVEIAKNLGHKDSSITTKVYIDLHQSESHKTSTILEQYL